MKNHNRLLNRRLFRLNALQFLLFTSPLFAANVSCEEVYKYVDEFGQEQYSTTPVEGSIAKELPSIQRENIDERIRKLKSQATPNCSSHGGIDCDSGPDTDGSVICSDGFRETSLRFSDSCGKVKLEIQGAVYITATGVRLTELPVESRKPLEIVGMEVPIRNLARGVAKDIEVYLLFPDRRRIEAAGPLTIDGFGMEEYSIALTEQLHRTPYYISQAQLRASCGNCSGVVNRR